MELWIGLIKELLMLNYELILLIHKMKKEVEVEMIIFVEYLMNSRFEEFYLISMKSILYQQIDSNKSKRMNKYKTIILSSYMNFNFTWWNWIWTEVNLLSGIDIFEHGQTNVSGYVDWRYSNCDWVGDEI